MIIDRREQIINQVKVALQGIPGYETKVYRNRADLTAIIRPAFVLLDGTEDPAPNFSDTSQRRNRARTSPVKLRLKPQIFALLKKQVDEKSEQQGKDLSALRMLVLQALLLDDDLALLVGENGDVAYRGMLTDMVTGSTLEGEIQFFFEIDYWLIPAEHLNG